MKTNIWATIVRALAGRGKFQFVKGEHHVQEEITTIYFTPDRPDPSGECNIIERDLPPGFKATSGSSFNGAEEFPFANATDVFWPAIKNAAEKIGVNAELSVSIWDIVEKSVKTGETKHKYVIFRG